MRGAARGDMPVMTGPKLPYVHLTEQASQAAGRLGDVLLPDSRDLKPTLSFYMEAMCGFVGNAISM